MGYTLYRRNRCIIFFLTKNVCALDIYGLQLNKLYVEYQRKLPSFNIRRRVVNDNGFWILEPNDKRLYRGRHRRVKFFGYYWIKPSRLR